MESTNARKPNTEIPLTAVKSSQIAAIGYDSESREMVVRFVPGKSGASSTYSYFDVAPETHAALVGADSVGSHFHTHVRKSALAYVRHEFPIANAAKVGLVHARERAA